MIKQDKLYKRFTFKETYADDTFMSVSEENSQMGYVVG